MDIFDSFSTIENIVSASEFLLEYLIRFGEGSFKPSLKLCLMLLSIDSGFHDELKIVHQAHDIAALDKLCTSLEKNAWRANVKFDALNDAIRSIKSENRISPVVRGELKRPLWVPDKAGTNESITDHIRNLEIPIGCFDEVPPLIVHKLGTFQHDSTLRKRLDVIFSSLHHIFLVNTSGTGKTRLLFEGLCLHWGLYLTFAVDSSFLGSRDLANAVVDLEFDRKWTEYLPSPSNDRYATALHNNKHAVYRTVSEALLSRLLVFKMYLEACSQEGFRHDHRQRWLESQIFTDTLADLFDPFAKIKLEINGAFVSDSIIDDAISRTLEDIQDIWEMPAGHFFYIVLDEANVASRKHDEAFADEYGHYPILKEILRSFQRRMGHLPIKFVVAGTMIPQEHFQSAAGEWDNFHWCSDTGCFDDLQEHRKYISQFLPSHFEKSDIGQALLHRMWQWLRGRYRYTASFLTVLLDNNFESPHTLLGGYIESLSEYMPHDHSEYDSHEKYCENSWYTSLGSKGLSRQSISTVAMHRSIISYLTVSKGCHDFMAKDITLVNEDYGLFLDTACSRIGLDEPVTITFGATWFKKNSASALVKLATIFARDYHTEIRPSHFALSLALSLALCFSEPFEISNAFTVSGIPTPWLRGRFVKFTKIDGQLEAVDIHFSEDAPDRLVYLAGTWEDVISWFKHECKEPFCMISTPASTGVTLVFCLRLSNKRTLWVSIHIPSTFRDENPNFAQDVKEAHPTNMFRDQPEIASLLTQIPNLTTDVGPSGILCISGSFRVKSATGDSVPPQDYPAGILNIEGLDEATKSVSRNMLMRRLSRIFATTKQKTRSVIDPVLGSEQSV
ncbi:hypothetical protein GGU10DRAFT_154918 [Lentinula aff. detonsa]|uniref:Uncharacterized protein n=2 Tax=Lentinula TaxID=5352 RepID=A0AA38NKD1_9AGAR|nr:hypothetical protein GGU10DRAFT_154918 [Lentinula aff. detonsa]